MHCLRVSLFAIGLLACGSKTDDKSGGGASKVEPSAPGGAYAAPVAPPPAGKVGPGRVSVLAISVEVPRSVQILSTTSKGKPGASILLGDGMVDLFSGDAAATTIEAVKAELQATKSPPQKFTKELVTSSGWHLEYLALGAVDKNKLYGLEVRTTIDGTTYHCRALTRFAGDAKLYASVCDSMQKAP